MAPKIAQTFRRKFSPLSFPNSLLIYFFQCGPLTLFALEPNYLDEPVNRVITIVSCHCWLFSNVSISLSVISHSYPNFSKCFCFRVISSCPKSVSLPLRMSWTFIGCSLGTPIVFESCHMPRPSSIMFEHFFNDILYPCPASNGNAMLWSLIVTILILHIRLSIPFWVVLKLE